MAENGADIPGEEPVAMTTEVATPAEETPAETPVETPAETPVETPAETKVETPAETPVEAPAETPESETPVETSAPEAEESATKKRKIEEISTDPADKAEAPKPAEPKAESADAVEARSLCRGMEADQLINIIVKLVDQQPSALADIKDAIESDPAQCKLFIRSLSWDTTDEMLKTSFEEFGEIAEAVVIKDKVSLKSKGFGFITFTKAASARAALQTSEREIDGRTTRYNLASERKNPRSGGGYQQRGYGSGYQQRGYGGQQGGYRASGGGGGGYRSGGGGGGYRGSGGYSQNSGYGGNSGGSAYSSYGSSNSYGAASSADNAYGSGGY